MSVRDKLDRIKQLKDELEQELKQIIQDKTQDLDERWDLFIESGLGNCESWIQDFKFWVPKFASHQGAGSAQVIIDALHNNYNRSETVNLEDLYHRLGYWVDDERTFKVKKYQYQPEFKELPEETVLFTQEDADLFREDCLSRFLRSFDWDW